MVIKEIIKLQYIINSIIISREQLYFAWCNLINNRIN